MDLSTLLSIAGVVITQVITVIAFFWKVSTYVTTAKIAQDNHQERIRSMEKWVKDAPLREQVIRTDIERINENINYIKGNIKSLVGQSDEAHEEKMLREHVIKGVTENLGKLNGQVTDLAMKLVEIAANKKQ